MLKRGGVVNKKEEAKVLTEEVVEALSLKEEVLSGDISNEEFLKTIKKNKSTIKKWVDLSVKYKNDTFKKCAEVWDGTVKGFFKDFVKNNKNKLKAGIMGVTVAAALCLSACSVEAGIVNEDGKKGLYFGIGGKEQSSQTTPSASENQNDSQMGDGVHDNTTGGYVFGGDGVWDGTTGKNDTTTPSGTTPDYTTPDYTTPDYTNPDYTTPDNPTTPDNWGEGGYVFGGENGNENGEGNYVDSTNPTDPSSPTDPTEPSNPSDSTSPTTPSTTPSASMNHLDDLVSQMAGRTFKVESVSVALDANKEVDVKDGNFMGVEGKFVTLICTSSTGDVFRLKVELNDFYLANGGKDPGFVKGEAVGAIYDSVAESAMDRYGMVSSMGM